MYMYLVYVHVSDMKKKLLLSTGLAGVHILKEEVCVVFLTLLNSYHAAI